MNISAAKTYIELLVLSRSMANGKKMYVSHIRAKLAELLTSKEQIPKEICAVWY